ncbi:unnamed protein product, partial [Sphacelaria rigidula]
EEEELRRKQAAEDEARLKGKTRKERVTDLLRKTLEERLELLRELLVLLHRAQEEAEDDHSHTKALGDPTIKPSERQETHDALLAQRQKLLEDIGSRIAITGARYEETNAKLEAAGGPLREVGKE